MTSTYSPTAGNPTVTVAPTDDRHSGITFVRLVVLAVGVVALTFGMFGIKHAERNLAKPVVVQAIPSASAFGILGIEHAEPNRVKPVVVQAMPSASASS